MDRRKHTLYVVLPDGTERKVGFMSPCADGVVLGTCKVEGVETSHLTVIHKEDKIQAHITSQEHPREGSWFAPVTEKTLTERVASMIGENMVLPLTQVQQREDILYITKKLLNLLDSLMNILYEEHVSPREIVHVLNFQRLIRKAPKLVRKLKESPQSFIGMCRAEEILKDPEKVFGFSPSKRLIVAHEGRLLSVDLSSILGAKLTSTLDRNEMIAPFSEITRHLGIEQYMAEVERKGFIQRLLDAPSSGKPNE